MYGYVRTSTDDVKKIKKEMKVVAMDMAVDTGIGIAFRIIPIPAVRGCLALAKIGVDLKMLYDSVKLTKHGLETMKRIGY